MIAFMENNINLNVSASRALFDVAPYVKEIGRGKAGARALTREQARTLFAAILNNEVDPIGVGAVLMAYRIKSEAPQELAGMLDAVRTCAWQLRLPTVPSSFAPVVLPSFNGARHSANLTPLLALLLAKRGVPTLVHATSFDEKRVTSLKIFDALNQLNQHSVANQFVICKSHSQVQLALTAGQCAVVSSESLCAGLDRLLNIRWTMGVRNSAHTLAKMFNPFLGASVQVVSVTHPEYIDAMREFYSNANHSQYGCLLMRGTEGEPVRSSKRPQGLEWVAPNLPNAGSLTLLESLSGSVTEIPDLPSSMDAMTTAVWIADVLEGKRMIPPVIVEQVDVLVERARVLAEAS